MRKRNLIICPLLFMYLCGLAQPGKVLLNHPKPGETAKIGMRVFVYTLQLDHADIAVYNPATDTWTETIDVFDKHQPKFTYTLANKIPTMPGRINGSIYGVPLAPESLSPNRLNVVGANQDFTGILVSNSLPAGTYHGHLDYIVTA